jgi:hypothetical protein
MEADHGIPLGRNHRSVDDPLRPGVRPTDGLGTSKGYGCREQQTHQEGDDGDETGRSQ